MITDVSGVLMIPANAVPIPTSAYAPGPAVDAGNSMCATDPTDAPTIAPMNRLGPNMPPAFPDA
jgi:hypothetical protein